MGLIRRLASLGAKREERQKAMPLKLARGEKAILERENKSRPWLQLEKEGMTISAPLVRGTPEFPAYLQGVFEVSKPRCPPELVYVYSYIDRYATPLTYAMEINVYNEKGNVIANFTGDLSDRKVNPEYRRLGIAEQVFDILEPIASLEGRPKLRLRTAKKSTEKFLKNRGYRLRGFGLNSKHNKNNPDSLLFTRHFSKRLQKGREWHDLSKFHRIKIIGADGKVKYWTGRVMKQ